jgi:hypothetical protein
VCSRSFYNPHGVTNPLIHFKFFQKKTIPVVENVIEKDRTPKHETSVEERPTLLWTSAKSNFPSDNMAPKKSLKMIKAFSNLPNAS